MKIKKLKFVLISCLALVCGLAYCLPTFANAKQIEKTQTITRTIEVKQSEIDYQSVLNDFEDVQLETIGDLTTFEGTKTIKVSDLLEYDLVSASDCENQPDSQVKYNFSYDKNSNIVTISAELMRDDGSIYFDEISGVAFINDNNEIDAIMNIDGEGILLSEMNNAGLINNCGWLSRLVKKVVKVAVVAVAVTAVVVATAAVVVATAGAAAPALVAAGVGITTSTATAASVGLGVAAGALFAATIGQSALKAGTALSEVIADGVEQIVDKATGTIISIIAKGVEYATIAVTSTAIYELEKNSYHLAAIAKDNCVYISKLPIDRVLATWATRLNIPIYTFYSENAYQVAKDAGDGLLPEYNAAHANIAGTSQVKKGIYFNHWHTAYHTGHCLYGVPVINL